MVAVLPDPSRVIPPGLTVIVQEEYTGNPLNSTVPVDKVHEG